MNLPIFQCRFLATLLVRTYKVGTDVKIKPETISRIMDLNWIGTGLAGILHQK